MSMFMIPVAGGLAAASVITGSKNYEESQARAIWDEHDRRRKL
jgi:hypothetical protein